MRPAPAARTGDANLPELAGDLRDLETLRLAPTANLGVCTFAYLKMSLFFA